MTWLVFSLIMLFASIIWHFKRKAEARRTREAYRMREIIDQARAALPAEPVESPIVQSFWRVRYALEAEAWKAKENGNGTHRDRKQMLRDLRSKQRNGETS
jgi:hypothetical protein